MSGLVRDYGSEATGLMWINGYEFHAQHRPVPFFHAQVVGFREVQEAELRVLGVPGRHGFSYSSVVADMSMYLPFLHRELERLGGRFLQGEITGFSAPFSHSASVSAAVAAADLLVNCTGLAPRQLLSDPHMQPIRGYLVRVYAPFIHSWYRCSDDWTYIFPRRNEVVLGGTYDVGVDDCSSDAAIRHRIIQLCSGIIPDVAHCRIVNEWIGVRPGRELLRLELELPSGGGVLQLDPSRSRLETPSAGCSVPIIHNYGAGGSGMTIHWGCANEVVELARRLRAPEGSRRTAEAGAGDAHGFVQTKLKDQPTGLVDAVKQAIAKL